jgi:TetR/AcrR family transcriptional regulator
MGVQERKIREKLRRGNEIVDAAEKVIFSKGLENTTMDDIALEAELGKATLYLYYKSKEEILVALSERAHIFLAKLFQQALESTSTGLGRARAIGAAYYRFSIQYPNYYQFIRMFESGEIGGEEQLQIALKPDQILAQAIDSGIKDGTIRTELTPRMLSKCLWGMLSGLLQLMHNRKEEFVRFDGIVPEEVINMGFDVLGTGIATPAGLALHKE